MKIHFHRLDPETGSRHFGVYSQRHPFVGLNPNDEHVLIA